MNAQFVKKCVITSTIAIITGNTFATGINQISPFVGVDGIYIHTKGKGEYSNYMPRDYPGLNFYVGAKVHENFGVELGLETTERKARTFTSVPGDVVFGSAILPGDNVTKVRMNSAHIDLNGYYPIADKTELLASVGLRMARPKFQGSFNDVNYPMTAKSTSVLRLRAGAQYMATDTIGVRGLVGWNNLSRIKIQGVKDYIGPGATNRPFKNSLSASVGAFVKF